MQGRRNEINGREALGGGGGGEESSLTPLSLVGENRLKHLIVYKDSGAMGQSAPLVHQKYMFSRVQSSPEFWSSPGNSASRARL